MTRLHTAEEAAALAVLWEGRNRPPEETGPEAGRAAYTACAPLLALLLPAGSLRHVIASGIARQAVAEARAALRSGWEGRR